jgi:hypothetical protein
MIEDQFSGLKGYDLVREGLYVLEEGFTGKDLDQHLPLALSFRRGMKVNMSMEFAGRDRPGLESCPRCHCHANNTSRKGMTIQW